MKKKRISTEKARNKIHNFYDWLAAYGPLKEWWVVSYSPLRLADGSYSTKRKRIVGCQRWTRNGPQEFTILCRPPKHRLKRAAGVSPE
jgi:hypothetical protein